MNQDKRLTVVFMNLYAEMGGGEVALYHLLKNLDRKRFEPVMIVNDEGPFVSSVRQLGIRTEILPFKTVMLKELVRPATVARAIRDSRVLRNYLSAHHADIIHCGDVLSLLLLASSIRKMRIPVVYNVIFQYEWTRLMAFNILAMLTVDRIVANSDAMKHHLERRTALPHGRVETIWPSVDTTEFHTKTTGEKNALREELHLPDHVKLIGMAGRFDPAKGHLVFLHAAAEIMKTRSDMKFVIAGGLMNESIIPSLKEYYDRVMQYCHEGPLKNHVVLLGQRNDMPAIMRSLDVYVCPSLSEGFGLTVVEALASGTPVVTSNAVGAIDLVRNRHDVFVAETGNSQSFATAIGRALEYGSSERVLSDTLPIENLGWSDYARRYENVYAELGIQG